MCGRYHHGPITERFWEELHAFMDALCSERQHRFNIAPTTPAVILRHNESGERELSMCRWGLLPGWAQDKKLAYKTFNARSETISEKPAFRSAFKKRRCFVLATGYYEWQKLGPKEKQTYDIRLTDDRPMLFYSLWERWRGPKDNPLPEPMETFTVITTDANELTAPVHDRMPCISEWSGESIDAWLNPEFQDTDYLKSLLQPFVPDEMETIKVSSYVNRVGNEGPECVQPIA